MKLGWGSSRLWVRPGTPAQLGSGTHAVGPHIWMGQGDSPSPAAGMGSAGSTAKPLLLRVPSLPPYAGPGMQVHGPAGPFLLRAHARLLCGRKG